MGKLTIQFATRIRGFFKQLIKSKYLDFKIDCAEKKVYETNSKFYKLKVNLIRSRLADSLGIIQRIKYRNKSGVDIIGSYNRFLETDLPYFIYVENPTALYHYTLNRVKTTLGRKRISKYINDPNLKALIFMSKACKNTFEELVGIIPPKVITRQIYPLAPANNYYRDNSFGEPKSDCSTRFLYISQGVRFFSKGGAEVIEAFDQLSHQYPNISLTIVTQLDYMSKELLERLKKNSQIKLLDFKLNQEEMQQLYANSDVLLQPTSDDSFGLTILEALHSGLAIIASSLYSIPEIVQDNYNGFLVEPHYWFFSKSTNLPNPEVWNHRKTTIQSGKISERLIQDLIKTMQTLIVDRNLLESMKQNSWKKSNLPPFSELYIANQWNELMTTISHSQD